MNKKWKLYLSIIVGLLLLLPIIVNSLYLFNSWHQIFEKPSKWSIFWATYLSSIASFAMVFITWRTLKQNKEQSEANKIANAEENEENRVANELANKTNREINKEENEKNRNLQLNLLKQQNEMQWLNMFRQIVSEYVQLYNANDIIDVVNMIGSNNIAYAQNIIKALLDRANRCQAQYTFFRKNDANAQQLDEFIRQHFEIYNAVVQDIQQIVVYRHRNPEGTISHLLKDMNVPITPDMRRIISEVVYSGNVNGVIPFIVAGQKRLEQIYNQIYNIIQRLYQYIQAEEERINKISVGENYIEYGF